MWIFYYRPSFECVSFLFPQTLIGVLIVLLITQGIPNFVKWSNQDISFQLGKQIHYWLIEFFEFPRDFIITYRAFEIGGVNCYIWKCHFKDLLKVLLSTFNGWKTLFSFAYFGKFSFMYIIQRLIYFHCRFQKYW